MKTSKLLSIVCLASALAFVGCKKKEATPPATGDQAMATKPAEPAAAPATPPAAPAGGATVASDDDYLTQASGMLDKMTAIVKDAGTDCDKLAAGITKMATENEAQMKALQAYEGSHPEAKKKFDETSKDKTKAFEEAAGPAMTACQNNAKVTEAFSKLGG